ncbi:MAG: nitroreductase family deazaflavin-dependent oxidoreductase [Acidimicrobiia bacterium]
MGLLEQIDYTVKPANRLQDRLQHAASRKWVSATLQRTLHPLDQTLHRISGGRHTAAGLLAGIPVIVLTTVGAKTGRYRTTPLMGTPMGDNLIIIGSNFGTKATPGWVHNLEADPRAAVTYRKRHIAVLARRANEQETERAFEAAAAIYAAFPSYRARAGHREIRVFALEAAE